MNIWTPDLTFSLEKMIDDEGTFYRCELCREEIFTTSEIETGPRVGSEHPAVVKLREHFRSCAAVAEGRQHSADAPGRDAL